VPVASGSDTVPGIPGASFNVMGNPVLNDLGHEAFQATITGNGISSSNNSGIWAESGSNGLTLIVQTGTTAPSYPSTSPLHKSGATDGTFLTLSDPVYSNTDTVAFLGTTGNGVGIWATTSGTLALVARAGDSAPDTTGSVSASSPVFAAFSQFVLPDQEGVIFLATLTNGTGGVTKANNQGIWAMNSNGVLKQVICTGNALTINGSVKIITALSLFNAPAASTGQARHFNNPANNPGSLAFKATFADGTITIVQTALP